MLPSTMTVSPTPKFLNLKSKGPKPHFLNYKPSDPNSYPMAMS